jgi:hypothetical protein
MRAGHVRRDNPRGLYEKEIGSGDWWIRYKDAKGRKRREHAGTKRTDAFGFSYRKRKQGCGRP